ncbi:hypothetical protein WP50_28090, partial [Lactiplantibacillus plantarum]
MADLFEKVGRPGKVLSTTPVYHGPIFDLVKQTIQTPDGLEVKRDGGGAAYTAAKHAIIGY